MEVLAQIDKLTMALVGVIILLVKEGFVLIKSLVTKDKLDRRLEAIDISIVEMVTDLRVVKDGARFSLKADVPMQEKQMEILIRLNTTLTGVQVLLRSHETRWTEIKDAMDKSEARLTDRIKEIGR